MSANIRSLDDFLLLLKGVKLGKDGQCTALCPGHDDRNRSLSVKQADGKLLFKCFAGCDTADILKPLKLEAKDLFLNSRKTDTKPEHRTIEAVYHYDGFEVVRTKPKGFYQRRLDGKGGHINNLKGVTLSLYHQAELRQAIDGGKAVYVAEGEKDVDRLRAEGFTATCNPMGAGKWRDSYSEALRGADLIIIPDNDGPGCDHASQVARSCYGKAARIRVLELPGDSKDVSDWLDIGHTAAELTQLTSQCPDYEPPADSTLPEIVVTDRHLRDITADALDALYKANKPERIFRRSSALTRISLDEKQRPYTEALGESAFRGCLARSCNFVRITAKGDRVAVPPPLDVVRDCLSLGEWQFPALLGITEAPVIRPDGTVMTKPGYDSATNLYYYPSPKLTVPPIDVRQLFLPVGDN